MTIFILSAMCLILAGAVVFLYARRVPPQAMKEKDDRILALSAELSAEKEKSRQYQELLANERQQTETLTAKLTANFENIAVKILGEKSKNFLETSNTNLGNLLNPLKDDIQKFKKQIEDFHTGEVKDNSALKREIELLRQLNAQVSEEAGNLARALKGESKTRGDWGEIQLEAVLEKAGLEKNIHYKMQESYAAEAGTERKRLQPDCIIYLPEGRALVIDSKVSLNAYEEYYNAGEDNKPALLKAHLDNVVRQINDLSSKNYQKIYEINQPDFVLMFIPLESALSLAARAKPDLFELAFSKNVLLLSTTTLLATLRTVAYLWKEEARKKNVLEIAQKSGAMYDKFVGLIENVKEIAERLEQARTACDGAMNKLYSAKRKGDTLVGKAEEIKTLGARAAREMPADVLEKLPGK